MLPPVLLGAPPPPPRRWRTGAVPPCPSRSRVSPSPGSARAPAELAAEHGNPAAGPGCSRTGAGPAPASTTAAGDAL